MVSAALAVPPVKLWLSYKSFRGRVIISFGVQNWPPQSFEWKPLDFFSVKFSEISGVTNKPTTRQALKADVESFVNDRHTVTFMKSRYWKFRPESTSTSPKLWRQSTGGVTNYYSSNRCTHLEESYFSWNVGAKYHVIVHSRYPQHVSNTHIATPKYLTPLINRYNQTTFILFLFSLPLGGSTFMK